MFERIRRFLAPKDEVPTELPTDEVAWSHLSALYGSWDFGRFNPDELIQTHGHRVYKRMMLDEQIKAVVYFKRGAITSRRHFFELDPSEVGDDAEEAERRVRIFEKGLEEMRGSLTDKMNGVLSAMYHGFSLTEKIFKTFELDGRTWWGIDNLKLRPFDTFTFVTDRHGNVERVIQRVEGDEQEIDLERFIHFVQNPEIDENYGRSELREAYRPWWSKDKIYKFRNIWLERHAGGFRWIQPTGDKKLQPGSQEYQQLQEVMQGHSGASAMILPGGYDFHLETPENNVAFSDALAEDNMAIAKALLVPNLLGISEQGDTGSYSQSETQLEAFLWTLDSDASRLEEVLNEDLFRPLGRVNFADGVYPRFRLKPLTDRQRNEVIKTWGELVRTGATTHDLSSENHVRELLEFPEREDEPVEEPPAGEEPPVVPPVAAGDGGQEPPAEGDDPSRHGETVVGRDVVSVSAFDRAVQRVAFAKIDREAETTTTAGTAEAAQEMDALMRDLVVKVEEGELDELEKVSRLKLDGRGKRKLRTVLRRTLKEAFNQGTKHAGSEVDKAKGEAFTVHRMDKERIRFVGEDYLESKSFEMAGNLSEAALAVVKGVILSGLKNDKPFPQVRQEIYQALARDGFLSSATAEAELGELLDDVSNPSARLDTVVRTGSFEAINEGRWATFTDPGLEGFVQAFDYSAILDRRTTQICRELDGKTYPKDSEVWTTRGFRPPNHHNCRSLLVAVTKRDTWTEDDPPDLEPQKGFG